MTGVTGLNMRSVGNLSGSRSQVYSTTSVTASPAASTERAAAQKSRKDSLTMMISEIRLSMVQSLFDGSFSCSPLTSLTESLDNVQAVNASWVFQDDSDTVLGSDALGKALESVNPAKKLMGAMEQTELAQRNPELVQTILQSLEPGSVLNVLA